jgi:glycosyltransferase involved in cell wall biosynthesis
MVVSLESTLMSTSSAGSAPSRRIAFASPHCLLDFTSGAANATVEQLKLLAGLGFSCEAFCGGRFDAPEEVSLEDVLARRARPFEKESVALGGRTTNIFRTVVGGDADQQSATGRPGGAVPLTVVRTQSSRGQRMAQDEKGAMLGAYADFLDRVCPDVLMTYGGDAMARSMIAMAKARGMSVFFFLHNFDYHNRDMFASVDRAVVPSEFARWHYRETIGMACRLLPLVVDPARVVAAERKPRYVTFVNPEPRKGVHVFARIAQVLAGRRPDIPLLLVEGIWGKKALAGLGIDLGGIGNLTIMPRTADPREFHAVTKLLLMPSLMENMSLVAIEAMSNGIPVLGSTRGGLPETIGDAGFLIDLPDRCKTETPAIPTADEVEPWVSTIIRLWDDEEQYRLCCEAASERSRLWRPEYVGPAYRDFFGGGHLPAVPTQGRTDEKELAFPPLPAQAWSLVRAVATFVGDGLRTVDTAQYQQRLGICDTCERRRGRRCAECGCWVALKARGRSFSCPLGRWPQP